MSQLLRKAFDVAVKSIDRDNHTVEAVVSTNQVDRHNEIILPSAFAKHLPSYKTNPILCWGHPLSKKGEALPPDRLIGRAEEIQIVHGGLWARWKYAVNENPMAKMCFDLVAGGYLKAYSIGGIMIDYAVRGDNSHTLAKLPKYARDALKWGEASLVVTELELLEVSNCFVGANRGCLARAVEEGVVSRDLAFKAYGEMDFDTGPIIISRNYEEEDGDMDFDDFLQVLAGRDFEAARELADLYEEDPAMAKDVAEEILELCDIDGDDDEDYEYDDEAEEAALKFMEYVADDYPEVFDYLLCGATDSEVAEICEALCG